MKKLINEVKRFQKIAGLLNEDESNLGSSVDRKALANKVREYYPEATPPQVAKLVNIYGDQMENEGLTDIEDFFLDLVDSPNPDAFISLKKLGKYKGY